jgi:hypothetical protein
MNKIPLAKRAVIYPLFGLALAWLAFMGATLANLYIPQPQYDSTGNQVIQEEVFQIAPFLFLIGIAAGALFSLIGQRLAIRSRHELGEGHKLSRAALRFANLGVVIGLIAGALFAIGNFLGAFNNFSGVKESLGMRLLNVYLPIILATGLVVYVLLQAFVFRQDADKEVNAPKQKLSAAQKALSLGYAVPILATAVAIIFGLAVYDVTRTDLQVWIWVIIIAIVASGVITGTIFSNQARAEKPAVQKAPGSRMALAVGAANLNFVLSIVFGSVVTIMAFTFGAEAIQSLQTFSQPPVNCKDIECNSIASVTGPSLQWLVEKFAPAKILMAISIIGIYLTITARNKESNSVKAAK